MVPAFHHLSNFVETGDDISVLVRHRQFHELADWPQLAAQLGQERRNAFALSCRDGWSEIVAQGWGVVKSLERLGCGPVGLVHTQNFQFFLKQKTHFCGSKATRRPMGTRLT